MKNVVIVLSHPQIGENIGAAARAMANFGLFELRIVNPRDGWPNEKAIAMASGAFDHMQKISIFSTTKEAVADCQHVYATTARPRDMTKPVCTPQEAAQEAIALTNNDHKIALLFGAERTGLTNDEIILAQKIISVPINTDFSSLNLGQAVLLLSYELSQAAQIHENTLVTDASKPAPQSQLHEFFDRLENELETHHFFRAKDLKPTMIRNIRNMFTRNNLTEQEIKTFHGIISALIGNKKAADE